MDSEKTRRSHNWNQGVFPTWAKMLVAVAVVLLFSLIFFRVRSFEVSGNVRYTAEEVTEASGITNGDILMAVNKTRTAGRLLTKLPYVEQVEIYKEMPGTVRFEIVECTASLMAQSEYGTSWLMTDSGKLLEETEESQTGYPMLRGVSLSLPMAGGQAAFTDEEKGALAMELGQAVLETGLSAEVSEIDVSDMENVTLRYGNSLTVQLGDGSDGTYKLRYLAAVAGQLEAGRQGILDLSFSSGEQAVFHPLT